MIRLSFSLLGVLFYTVTLSNAYADMIPNGFKSVDHYVTFHTGPWSKYLFYLYPVGSNCKQLERLPVMSEGILETRFYHVCHPKLFALPYVRADQASALELDVHRAQKQSAERGVSHRQELTTAVINAFVAQGGSVSSDSITQVSLVSVHSEVKEVETRYHIHQISGGVIQLSHEVHKRSQVDLDRAQKSETRRNLVNAIRGGRFRFERLDFLSLSVSLMGGFALVWLRQQRLKEERS